MKFIGIVRTKHADKLYQRIITQYPQTRRTLNMRRHEHGTDVNLDGYLSPALSAGIKMMIRQANSGVM